jgi:NSS family neurotransmitter:Na+ symporter
MISIFEVPVAFLVERYGWRRPVASLFTGVTLALVGATSTLSYSKLANVKLFGKGFFDLYDFASSNILLPLGGIFIALFVGWVWRFSEVEAEGSNAGRLNNRGLLKVFHFLVRYAAPVAILVVLLSGLGIIKF